MGGGLMQLVAYGAQDIYLTGNPQITFFKVVYRRHTNFSVEAIEQTFNGTTSFGQTVTATISRNGDLVTNMYLEVELPALGNLGGEQTFYTDEVGNALIEEVKLEIGGQEIDKHFSEWLSIWSELNLTVSQKGQSVDNGYCAMVGKNPFNEAGNENALAVMARGPAATGTANVRLFVPLRFWFNRNPGLALPLIALQYHEVKVQMKLRDAGSLVRANNSTAATTLAAFQERGTTDTVSLKSAKLFVDYVYLDTDERRRFAQVSHEYLIEQLQRREQELSQTTANVDLNFNHPVKELVWVCVRADKAAVGAGNSNEGNQLLNFDGQDNEGRTALEHFGTAKLQLNGHDRFSARDAKYFRVVQPYQHHTSAPLRNVYVYSFALKPEEHQPSGTCNFSRIDNAKLNLQNINTGTNLNLKVFAVNYNVLRIMSGMGGLAYSN